ncbi:flagellar hook protein FlgE [Brevundimonas sp. NPDC092305]|uniref:flagellar hook protein FlgE n=1 Tax=Brevundimonas sp. NPDC092305 TaxID=3363957 RepID=UPI0038107867
MQATITTAAAGLSQALKRFEDSAIRTAQAPLDNLAEETVERLQARTAVAANVAVLRTAQDMSRALLDIKV